MKYRLSIILLLFGISTHAQDNLGIAGSSRSPVNTVLNNPSSIVDSRAFIDFNLVGASIFARNNLIYIPGGGFSLRNPQATNSYGLNNAVGKYAAYADVGIHGPSVTFAVKKHAFGLYTGARVVSDLRGIPGSSYDLITEGFQNPDKMGQLQSVKNVRANALAWGEAGLSYGTILARRGYAILTGGLTVKRLFGLAGAGVRIDEWSYIVRDSSHLETQTFKGEYGFNDPTAGYLNGKGWSGDIGFTYKMRLSDSEGYTPYDPCTDGDYKYKIGVSILDVGRIRFNPPYYRNLFNQDESSEWENYAGSTANDISDIDSLINNNFSLAEQNGQDGRFRMKLPTAFSVQGDYNFGHNLYLYGVITYGLPRLNSLGVQRASYLGIAPRWESKRFEFSLPISLYEFKSPQVGFCMRLNSVIIGSDNLAALLLKKDIYGADFYLSLKYTIFRHWKCSTGKKKESTVNRSSKQPLPCPSW